MDTQVKKLSPPIEINIKIRCTSYKLYARSGTARRCTQCAGLIEKEQPWGQYINEPKEDGPMRHYPVCRMCLAKEGLVW